MFTDYSGPVIWTKLRKSLLKQQTNSKRTKQTHTHTQCSLGGDSIGSMVDTRTITIELLLYKYVHHGNLVTLTDNHALTTKHCNRQHA